MTRIDFLKGHGTGNDFVLVPDPDGALDLTPEVVAALCDRRFGIGGDGVLRVVRSAAHPQTAAHRRTAAHPQTAGRPAPEWFMDYRNADGSVAEMCGNGARVFVRYLVDTGLAPADRVTILTRTGPVAASATDEAVTVELRLPNVYGESVARLGGRDLPGVAVDCGNPHLVCQLPADLDLEALDLTVPPAVDPEFFPAGVNVELVTGSGDEVRMRVCERGVGETLSCGSGACAVGAVALRRAGRGTGTVAVDVPGGRLTVTFTDRVCALAGPAVLIAHGRVDLSTLRVPVAG